MARWFILLAISIACGCRSGSLDSLDAPEQITLYSIDGRDEERRGEAKASEFFHGYPVLGKVEISDSGKRNELIAALKDGITRKPDSPAKCYWPRHGLRVTQKGKIVEFVICFECSRFEEFEGATKVRHELINRDIQPKFDKPLQDAGIPLAPK